MPEAQSAIGSKYREGSGLPHDYAEALKWYRLAADQGDAEGQRRVGEAYAFGKGVAQDLSEAQKWSRNRAKHGPYAAQTLA